ncbi:Exopolygalacturonase-like protein, partial [Drosera capensis]
NLKFVGMNRTIVHHITSVNSKFFHIALVNCKDFKGRKIYIKAPRTSPNTDGIHLERCSGVHISSSIIGTGDDCISIGQGNSQVTATNITCGPGHGISVGSLGIYPNEKDVKGLIVRDCKMIGTWNGISFKTWPNSPGRSKATNLTFENIVMENVRNPIIINQEYCPSQSCSSQAPSMVKLSEIRFKNITSTTLSDVAVRLSCSKGVPCQEIYLEEVHLSLSTGEAHPVSSCENVIAKCIGTQVPAPCR